MRYDKYDLAATAKRALNYLAGMVDPKMDYLPYWLVNPVTVPAFAKHCRVDDAEIVASWYEALVCCQEILGTDDGTEVREGFERHLMKSWGPKGLRYHEPYPWARTIHSSFHEMGYVLSALNCCLACDPENAEVEKRASELVRGLRSLVIERKTRTFWSGDFPLGEKIYEFPNDVYLKDRGWDFTCVTGRGELAVRNATSLFPLVKRYEMTGDEVALDLATGLANHLLGLSRYFNYRSEFFGHIHSTVWIAAGLTRLGRLIGNEYYVRRAKAICDYVISLSSSFGWVPEYAQWHPPSEEFCETCCIKDVIECAFELIAAGYDEYWDVINRFVRNQLDEQQIKSGDFVEEDSALPDTEDTTYRNMKQRVVGSWTGGGDPNSISLARFRCIAGCCVGTAPQALHMVWKHILAENGDVLTVNLPIETMQPAASVEIGYPNEGYLQVTLKKDARLKIRALPFMGSRLRLTVNGAARPVMFDGDLIDAGAAQKGDIVRVEHRLQESVVEEVVKDQKFAVTWRGCDVVRMDPPGQPLRLYQRQSDVPKDYSRLTSKQSMAPTSPLPTDQKKMT